MPATPDSLPQIHIRRSDDAHIGLLGWLSPDGDEFPVSRTQETGLAPRVLLLRRGRSYRPEAFLKYSLRSVIALRVNEPPSRLKSSESMEPSG